MGRRKKTESERVAYEAYRKRYAKEYREKNKEKLQSDGRERARKRYQENQEACRAISNEWKRKNKEYCLEYRRDLNAKRITEGKPTIDKAYYDRHREKAIAKSKKWYEANKEKLRNDPKFKARRSSYGKKWKQENAEKVRHYTNKRNAIKLALGGAYTPDDIDKLWASQAGRCANPSCGKELVRKSKNGWHIDHIMPLILGGSNDPVNLQILCPPCNGRKGGMHPDDWAALNTKST